MADNLSQEKGQEAQQLPSEKSRLDRVIDVVAAIFVPIINLLCAAGILKGLLVIGVSLGAVSQDSTTYLIANAMADSLFYFLPMFLAYTAAKRFGGNPFTCVIIAGILLYPGLTEVLAAGDTISFLAIPIKGAVYHSSVLPILLAAYFLAVLERAVSSRLPDVLKGFLTPLICIFVGGTVTLFAFGPIGAFVGEWLAVGYEAIYVVSPILTGLVIGAIFQPMVIFGLHWALMIISMNNVAVLGSDTILALFAASIFAQGGAALAVMLKTKSTSYKSVCGAAVVSAIFGITEPALFGVTLPRKKPLLAVCAGGGAGGMVAGFSGAQASAFAIPSATTFPIFFGNGFALMIVSVLVGFAVSFALTMLLKFEATPEETEQADSKR